MSLTRIERVSGPSYDESVESVTVNSIVMIDPGRAVGTCWISALAIRSGKCVLLRNHVPTT